MALPGPTQALLDSLASALGIAAITPARDGGVRLTSGGTDIILYGDDETILLVAPVAPLPRPLGHGLALSLLRNNLFSSSCAPFQIAADETETLVMWGRLWISDLDGATFAGLIDAVAGKVEEIRGELRTAPPEPAADSPPPLPDPVADPAVDPARA